MMTGGVDFSGSPGGGTSATHGEAELDETLKVARKAVRMLRQEGEIDFPASREKIPQNSTVVGETRFLSVT